MHPAVAILLGAAVAGALDIAFAITFAATNGTPPMKLLQIVASGLFGRGAFEGGARMAAAGLALHFLLSLGWAVAFAALAWQWRALVAHPLASGIVWGVLVFFAMRLVVLPLSAFPFPVSFKPLATVLDLLSHAFLFGVPIAFAARRALQLAG